MSRRFRLSARLAVVMTLVPVLVLGALVAGCARRGGKPIRIAVAAPLTGSMAVVGQQFVDGAKLAIDEVNAQGGINGRKVELVTQDDRNDPKEAASIAQKLSLDKDLYGVLGGYSSSASFASIPIYEKARIVEITPSASHPKLPEVSKYMFRMWTGIDVYAPQLADFAVTKRGLKKLAVIYVNNDFGKANRDYFVQKAKSLGATIVGEETFLDGDKDFKTQLTKIKAARPDALVIISYYVEGALIAQQARTAGLTVQIVSTGTFMEPEFLKLAGAAAEGIFFNTEFHPDDPRPTVQDFIKKFKGAFPGKDPAPYHATSYDATAMLLQVLKQVNLDRSKVAEALANIQFSGAEGPISWRAGKGIVKQNIFVEIRNGKFVLVTQ
ncbi:MAG: ABC transporter substrate-binding protein [Actinobacteria bacterium]|nr:ABC transporter substrate-binding protein [Actinomycetota bacterium]